MIRACWALGALGATLVSACDDAPATREVAPANAEHAVIELAFPQRQQAQRVRLGADHTECATRDGVTTVELSRASASGRDLLFLARWDARGVLDAHVWLPEETLEHGDGRGWVQVVAADIPGAHRDCRVEHDEQTTRVVCNDAVFVPWTAAGAPPAPSFRVTFECA